LREKLRVSRNTKETNKRNSREKAGRKKPVIFSTQQAGQGSGALGAEVDKDQITILRS
jgi:mannitol-specific phosphotransferase system IIBC component